MKSIKFLILIVIGLFIVPISFSQGCEDPGEGDGINIFGYIQPQYDYNILGENGTFTKDKDESGFYFKRARLGVLGNIPYDFTYYFMMEFSPERGMGINDAFVTYNRYSFAKISMGLFKAPFSAEQIHACHKLHTIERSMVVNELAGPIRDTGLMLSGRLDSIFGYKNKGLFSYQLAVINGEGRNVLDADNRKNLVGRIKVSPIKDVSLGLSYKYGKTPAKTAELDDNKMKRLGFDLTAEYKGFLLTGEVINASDIGSYTTGGGCSGEPLETHQGSLDRSGYYVTALYKTSWGIEPVIKYESYDANINEIGDIKNRWTIGFNYFFNEWTRLQVNYNYNFEENINVEIPNDALMIQLQAIIK
jgi:phosphate-selective porin